MSKLDKDAYLYGLIHAHDIMKSFKGDGMRALSDEIKVRTGGMKLPANIDFCAVTELARRQMQPELQCISVAMAWALERGLKLPPVKDRDLPGHLQRKDPGVPCGSGKEILGRKDPRPELGRSDCCRREVVRDV